MGLNVCLSVILNLYPAVGAVGTEVTSFLMHSIHVPLFMEVQVISDFSFFNALILSSF